MAKRRFGPGLQWISVAVVGLAVGGVAFFGEMREGGVRPPLAQLLFVGEVYAGLGLTGLLIGFACLGQVLGFAGSDRG